MNLLHILGGGALLHALTKKKAEAPKSGPVVAPPPPKATEELSEQDRRRLVAKSLHIAQQRMNWGEPPEQAARAGASQAVDEYVLERRRGGFEPEGYERIY